MQFERAWRSIKESWPYIHGYRRWLIVIFFPYVYLCTLYTCDKVPDEEEE